MTDKGTVDKHLVRKDKQVKKKSRMCKKSCPIKRLYKSL